MKKLSVIFCLLPALSLEHTLKDSSIFTVCIAYRSRHLHTLLCGFLYQMCSRLRILFSTKWKSSFENVNRRQKCKSFSDCLRKLVKSSFLDVFSETIGININLWTLKTLKYEWELDQKKFTDLLKFCRRQQEQSSLGHRLRSFPKRESKHGR